MDRSIGHADYWPNGGKFQAGCEFDDNKACSHLRAVAYYAESLNSNRFIGKSCLSYDLYSAGLCNINNMSPMGTFNDNTWYVIV